MQFVRADDASLSSGQTRDKLHAVRKYAAATVRLYETRLNRSISLRGWGGMRHRRAIVLGGIALLGWLTASPSAGQYSVPSAPLLPQARSECDAYKANLDAFQRQIERERDVCYSRLAPGDVLHSGCDHTFNLQLASIKSDQLSECYTSVAAIGREMAQRQAEEAATQQRLEQQATTAEQGRERQLAILRTALEMNSRAIELREAREAAENSRPPAIAAAHSLADGAIQGQVTSYMADQTLRSQKQSDNPVFDYLAAQTNLGLHANPFIDPVISAQQQTATAASLGVINGAAGQLEDAFGEMHHQGIPDQLPPAGVSPSSVPFRPVVLAETNPFASASGSNLPPTQGQDADPGAPGVGAAITSPGTPTEGSNPFLDGNAAQSSAPAAGPAWTASAVRAAGSSQVVASDEPNPFRELQAAQPAAVGANPSVTPANPSCRWGRRATAEKRCKPK